VLVGCSIWTLDDFNTIAYGIVRGEYDLVASFHIYPPIYNETRENDNVVLPISKGYSHGKVAYFVATDASSNETAMSLSIERLK
jgi:hypothetical protein